MISASETAIGILEELRRVPEPRQVPREEERDVSVSSQVLVDGLPVEESPVHRTYPRLVGGTDAAIHVGPRACHAGATL